MNTPQRLFDCLELHLKNSPLPDMLAGKENGQWKTYSTQEVKNIVDRISAGLLQSGISSGDMTPEGRDKISIISKNRPEWVMIDLATMQIGAVLVPIYPTININELKFILNDAEVKILIVNNKDDYEKVLSIKDEVPSLREIITIEKVDGATNLQDLMARATPEAIASIPQHSAKIKYEDLATIIYTSGTTGRPKGVMLSHKNILSNVMASIPCFPPGENMRALSFLPLNHVFERMISFVYMFKGTAIYFAESLDTIADNLREVKPDLFTTVPRLLEKVYEKIMAKGAALTGMKRALFFWAHKLASRYEINTNMGFWYNQQLKIANKLIFSKWREALGNNIKCIVTGGAACQVRLIRIFTAAGITVMEGYGLTETSPVISVNRFQEKDRKFGTVGPLISGVEVKIAEDGEILTRGPHVMMGYYKHPELTAEVMVDGWFKTGDIGLMEEGRFLKITDRKKEMFKTSGGKYVAPLPIENKLKESRFIEQVIVLGPERKFVSALIVPSFANLTDWAKEKEIAYSSVEDLIKHPEVINLYAEIIQEFNKHFNHVEQVKKFELLPREWSIDTGEMTPKLSLKRKVIMERYNDVIEKMYST